MRRMRAGRRCPHRPGSARCPEAAAGAAVTYAPAAHALEVWVHAGTPKTGTTSIQSFLQANRAQLAARGWYYPQSGIFPAMHPNHNHLTDHLLSYLRPLQEELAAAGATRVLLSAEDLLWQYPSDESLQIFAAFLRRLGAAAVHVIFYLREPGAVLSSQLQMMVKLGGTELDYERCAPGGPLDPILDSRGIIERWGRAFGREHLHIRLFERQSFCGGDLLTDFLDVLGVRRDESFVPVAEQNERITLLEMQLLLHINRRVPGSIFTPGTLKQRLFAGLHRHLATDDPAQRYAPPQALHEAHLRRWQEGNDWVRRQFFPQRARLFEPPAAPYRENHDLPGLSGQQLEALAAACIDLARGGASPMQSVVRLRGGLGGQLFGYAFARAWGVAHGCAPALDGQDLQDGRLWLTCFQVVLAQAQPQQLRLLDERLAQGLEAAVEEERCECGVCSPGLIAGPPAASLRGSFMSWKYFQALHDELCRELTLTPAEAQRFADRCGALAERIGACCAVAVHLPRRAPERRCTAGYYRLALQQVAAGGGDGELRCFVFSDDPAWARGELETGLPVSVVDLNPPHEAHFDLELMRRCRHHILASSSLGWWGAWLGHHPRQIVIAPQPFRESERLMEFRDLCPPHWRLLPRLAP